jgi:F0F1-type ATP synthase gamma subunit
MNKEQQIIQDLMPTFSDNIIKEFILEYSVSEQEARKALAEMYYANYYIR